MKTVRFILASGPYKKGDILEAADAWCTYLIRSGVAEEVLEEVKPAMETAEASPPTEAAVTRKEKPKRKRGKGRKATKANA